MREVYIVMGFNQDAIKTQKVPFSGTAWRVIPFLLNQQETQFGSATYIADLGVCKAQVTSGNVVQPKLNTHINLAQQTDLAIDGDTPTFSTPYAYNVPDGFAVNSQLAQTITVGAGLYNDQDGTFDVISVWQDVWNTSTVDVVFTPVLSIFAAAEFVQSQLLPGHIASLLWNQDLADPELPEPVNLSLTWNDAAQKYVLKSAN
jgi:hypothetical protein